MNEAFLVVIDYLANSGVLFSVIISLVTLVIYAHLILIQTSETVTRKDFLTKYRSYILVFLLISFLTLIPVTYYLVMRYIGVNDEDLRNFATLSGRIGPLAQAIAFEIIFFYRKRE